MKIGLIAAALVFGVPAAFSAPENREEFARQYLPESQAVFERFRKECAETKTLRDGLAEELRVMNRELYDDAAYTALCEKASTLDAKESAWAKTLEDAFLRHKANMVSSAQLVEKDDALSKENIAWEAGELKVFLKTLVANFGAPICVKIPGKNYSFGKYEVTQWQYERIMGENPSRDKGWNLPVHKVSREDAEEYCEKLTKRERALGHISANMRYRLPTEKEWIHACKAGTTTEYYTGDTEEDLDRAGWFWRNSGGGVHPVGQKEPNAFGLYDMLGNVDEWLNKEGWVRDYSVVRGGFRVVLDPERRGWNFEM